MSFATAIKGLIFKKASDRDPLDPRRSHEPIAGGRRQGENDNPYLAARRTWNDHVGSVVSSRQTWQVIGTLSLMIALAGVGGVIHIGSQSRFVPYVIEVDKLGQSLASGPVTATSVVDPKVLKATISAFIENARIVTPDVALQRRAVFRVYSHLPPNVPATSKMNEWLNGTAESSPFSRAATEMVNIDITSVLRQSPDSWQVDWKETSRDRQGVLTGAPQIMRALVTVFTAEPTPQTTEEQIRNNPLGIYVRDYSWSRLN